MLLEILLLLWLINFIPPMLAHLLGDRWGVPLDRGRLFRDGLPLLGFHKTGRGVAGGIVAGALGGMLLGFPWWIGLLAGMLSMAGDLVASFIKRRLGISSGHIMPGLDQGPEGLLPFLVLGPYCSLGGWEIILLAAFFSVGAYFGSWFLKRVLLTKPYDGYPRPVSSQVRWKEFRSCQIKSPPLHLLANINDTLYYRVFMTAVFKGLGLYEKGRANALDVGRNEITFHFPDLPQAFDGYTILFFSDLHLDGLPELTDRILSLIRDIRADLCIIGGDFRMETHGPFAEALVYLRRLIPEIRARDGVLGVLGNHDCIEIIEPLEAWGMKFLVNESVFIERDEERIWIVGVDDPHYYRCHDLEQAFEGVPRSNDLFRIFVAHSSEIYREASAYGVQLYLCGHTHAGQIQIPPFGPIFTHTKAPRRFCGGTWHHEKMLGYTSCGAGVSGVPVRFASRGEVLLIKLRRGASLR